MCGVWSNNNNSVQADSMRINRRIACRSIEWIEFTCKPSSGSMSVKLLTQLETELNAIVEKQERCTRCGMCVCVCMNDRPL